MYNSPELAVTAASISSFQPHRLREFPAYKKRHELAALKEEAFDLDLLGFDGAEIDRLLAGNDDETADLGNCQARGRCRRVHAGC